VQPLLKVICSNPFLGALRESSSQDLSRYTLTSKLQVKTF